MSIEATITDIPDGTVSFAIILDDLDVPWKKEYNHWIITMYIRPRRMMWIRLVVKTKEKSLFMRPAGIRPVGRFLYPTWWFLMEFIRIYR